MYVLPREVSESKEQRQILTRKYHASYLSNYAHIYRTPSDPAGETWNYYTIDRYDRVVPCFHFSFQQRELQESSGSRLGQALRRQCAHRGEGP